MKSRNESIQKINERQKSKQRSLNITKENIREKRQIYDDITDSFKKIELEGKKIKIRETTKNYLEGRRAFFEFKITNRVQTVNIDLKLETNEQVSKENYLSSEVNLNTTGVNTVTVNNKSFNTNSQSNKININANNNNNNNNTKNYNSLNFNNNLSNNHHSKINKSPNMKYTPNSFNQLNQYNKFNSFNSGNNLQHKNFNNKITNSNTISDYHSTNPCVNKTFINKHNSVFDSLSNNKRVKGDVHRSKILGQIDTKRLENLKIKNDLLLRNLDKLKSDKKEFQDLKYRQNTKKNSV